jgi:hypothetical protein
MAFIIDETTNARKLIKTETDGITLSQIAECLRDYRVNTSGKLDLGLLATSAKINKWAKYRPFEPAGNKTNEQTEQTRKQGAYGFYWWNINQEADAPFARTASALLTKAINNNGEWKVRPLTTYRIADFNGYDNSAERPYDYYTFEQNYIATRKMYIMNILEGKNIQIRLSDMPDIEGYNDAISDWSVVFIYKDESGTIRTVDTGMTVEELHGSGNGADNISTYAEVSLTPVTDDSTKKYDYVWAATNANLASSEEVTWLYFPESYGQMSVLAALIVSYSTFDNVTFELYDVANNYIDKTNKNTPIYYLTLGIEADSRYEFPIKIEYKLTCWDGDDASSQEHTFTDTQTVVSWEAFTKKYSIGEYVDATPLNLKLTLDVVARRSDNNTLLSTQHFDFMTGKLENGTANKNNAPTVYEINNNGVLWK